MKLGNIRRQGMDYEDIRTKIGVDSIEEKMRENRLRWFGYMRLRAS